VFYNKPYNPEKGALTMKMNAIANKEPEENTQGETPTIQARIIELLAKIDSPKKLERIYKFIKYIYIRT